MTDKIQAQDTNEDGLVAGQEVDFDTLMRVNRQKAKAENHNEEGEEDAPSKPKAKRKTR